MAESNQSIDVIMALKSAVLNIDWEISDETLDELNREVVKLQTVWAEEKVLLVYLQILGALCQYIGVSREKSHPGTFMLLKGAFDGLEQVVVDPDMSQSEKNSTVMGYADRYNKLKQEIATGSFTPAPARKQEEDKSTIDMVMKDEDDHSTDTVFDSMLNAMVQAPGGISGEQDTGESESDTEMEPESPPEVVATPSVRPPVQVAFNKNDGIEVDSDRNEDDEFVEADELLEHFFSDDDEIAGFEESSRDDEIVDLDEFQDDEKDEISLELDKDKTALDFTDHYDEDLIVELGDDTEKKEESFQDMEDTLDDFFTEDDDLLEPLEVLDDDSLIEDALDDFFGDDEGESLSVKDVSESIEFDLQEDEVLSIESNGVIEEEEVFIADSASIDNDLRHVDEESESDSLDTSDAEDFLADEDIEDVSESDPLDVVPDDVTGSEIDDLDEELTEPVAVEPLIDGSCVENLQMLLLSVQWEVDDQLSLRLEEEVDSLGILLEGNASAGIHLKFLRAVIRYISREQADVISGSMACLKLITESLESLLFDQTGQVFLYEENAVRSFVDWHELVVLDFEEQLAQVDDHVKDVAEGRPEESVEVIEAVITSPDPALSVEMQEMKDCILQEVRTLISQELAKLKG